MTVPQLMDELRESYQEPGVGKPVIKDLPEYIDWQAWFRPHAHKVNDIKQGHQFVFDLRNIDGVDKCLVSSKLYAAMDEQTRETIGTVLKVIQLSFRGSSILKVRERLETAVLLGAKTETISVFCYPPRHSRPAITIIGRHVDG